MICVIGFVKNKTLITFIQGIFPLLYAFFFSNVGRSPYLYVLLPKLEQQKNDERQILGNVFLIKN
jgi:hypothetical protein